MTGRTEQLTLLERQFFLDQFLKQCCRLNYIAESKELELFLRFDGADLGKEISKLQYRTKTMDQIQLLRDAIGVNEVSKHILTRDVEI